MAAEMKAVTADHLVHISEAGIKAIASSGTVAVLLPGTTFSLGSHSYAPVRRMIEEGVIISLSTDCNPGSSFTESLAMVISLAAIHMKLTAAESISAVTVNASVAVERSNSIGRLEEGMKADLVIWDMNDYRELPYHYGVNLVNKVVKNGKLVVGL